MKNRILVFVAAVGAISLGEQNIRFYFSILAQTLLSLRVPANIFKMKDNHDLSGRLEAYQNATGLTDGEIEIIRQKSALKYHGELRMAEYAYNNDDVKGFTSPLIWNDEIINIGIGNSFHNLISILNYH